MKLLVEGWLGFNHSYALVNQYQLLEIYKKDIDLYHNHLPNDYGWNTQTNDHGLSIDEFHTLESIPKATAEGNQFDVEYRISYPFRAYPSYAKRLFVFGTSEYQHIDASFFYGQNLGLIKNLSTNVVTPSKWSSIGFIKAGVDTSRIKVIPHGVNTSIFTPEKKAFQKETRASLNLNEEHFVILSIGAMTRNKGIDLLIIAYLILRKKYSNLRLVLKDLSPLYSISAKSTVESLRHSLFKDYFNETYLSEIILISKNLSLMELSNLYAAVDCYVSPYRAEGFNLTPLEAAACGTPILVTKGGATDDYYETSMGDQIEGKLTHEDDLTWIEPNIESLIERLVNLIEGNETNFDSRKSLDHIRKNYTWLKVTEELLGVMQSDS
jgi:glycosyltransferase involved in cell wall biosynthesis